MILTVFHLFTSPFLKVILFFVNNRVEKLPTMHIFMHAMLISCMSVSSSGELLMVFIVYMSKVSQDKKHWLICMTAYGHLLFLSMTVSLTECYIWQTTNEFRDN